MSADDDDAWAEVTPAPENIWVLPADKFDALAELLEQPPAPTSGPAQRPGGLAA